MANLVIYTGVQDLQLDGTWMNEDAFPYGKAWGISSHVV